MDETGQPAKKRMKFENISNWGDEDATEDDENYQCLRDWLVRGDENISTEVEGNSDLTVATAAVDTKRLK